LLAFSDRGTGEKDLTLPTTRASSLMPLLRPDNDKRNQDTLPPVDGKYLVPMLSFVWH
jgi:hypothetical protein